MPLNDRIEDTPVDLRITRSWWGSAEQYGQGMFIALVKRVSVSLVLQRRFLELVGFWPETASRRGGSQSCQAREQVAMKRCSKPLSCESSL